MPDPSSLTVPEQPNTGANATARYQARVWQLVNAIPTGHVATYGQIAGLAGLPQQARLVGRILGRLPADTRLPWHRVTNGRGQITNPDPQRQCQRLQAEGVVVKDLRVSLATYRWQP
jgi:methylated-DNA-protein-cysteine methyltransferase-like protein